MKVYANYPMVDVKTAGGGQVTTMLQSKGSSSNRRDGFGDSAAKEVIDLTTKQATLPMAVINNPIDPSNLCNVNAKTRSYELTSINNSMITIYDGAAGNKNEFNVQIQPTTKLMGGNPCVASTSTVCYVPKEQSSHECRAVNGLDILQGISKGKGGKRAHIGAIN